MFAYRPRAEAGPRATRPVLRHTDLAALVVAWRRLSAAVDEAPVDVVYANPCRFLQGPLATAMTCIPTSVPLLDIIRSATSSCA